MHLIVDYERRLREDSDSKQALDENSRNLLMKVCLQLGISQVIIIMQNPDTVFQYFRCPF